MQISQKKALTNEAKEYVKLGIKRYDEKSGFNFICSCIWDFI